MTVVDINFFFLCFRLFRRVRVVDHKEYTRFQKNILFVFLFKYNLTVKDIDFNIIDKNKLERI